MPVRKPDVNRQSPAGEAALVRDSLAERLPTLIEFLTERQYEDQSPRELPTLTLFAESGVLKAALNDRDTGRVAFVTGASLLAVLEALEEGLVFGNLDWRPSRSSKSRRN